MGLTPARFDLLVAIGAAWSPTQTAVRRTLGVARSTLSEMVTSIEQLGWVRRVRALDRRTWDLVLTRRGRVLLRWAYRCWINRGVVPIAIDATLASGEPEVRTEDIRFELIEACNALRMAFGRGEPKDLYLWHPDDYVGAFADPPLPANLPYVT